MFIFEEEEVNDKLEHIGNKLPLEKKLNISASNNYFDKKKEKYKESGIAICKKLGNSSLSEWYLDNIVKNDEKICAQVKDIFKKWIADYEPIEVPEVEVPVPTEEDLAMMKILREKGLIP